MICKNEATNNFIFLTCTIEYLFEWEKVNVDSFPISTYGENPSISACEAYTAVYLRNNATDLTSYRE